MTLPIRIRLTLWYSSILLITLLVFGVTAYGSIRAALRDTVDAELATRVAGVESYLRREVPRFDGKRIRDELDENVLIQAARNNTDLEPLGGEMLQISDGKGQWLCQSRSMSRLHVVAPRTNSLAELKSVNAQGTAVRLRTASFSIDGKLFIIQVAEPMAPLYRALDRFSRWIIGCIPLLVLAASAGGYWLSRRALRPVDSIIEASRAITHRNLSQRLLVPQSGDELQRLSETLNQMIERLDAGFRRMTRFTADTSHELRSPVALIRTTAEVALLKPRPVPEYKAALGNVLGEAERMTALIEDLLTLARADSNAFAGRLGVTDVRELVQHAGEQIKERASKKRITCQIVVPNDPVDIVGEPSMLRRLFLILMDNAVKYTQEGGCILVSLHVLRTEAIVRVEDSGIGIAQEELALIFERFYRSDKARQRDGGGAGLGLSIASWIADAHDTEIAVQSKLGVGSCFSVALPRVM